MTWQEIAQQAQAARDQTVAAVQPPVPDVPSDLSLNVIDIPRQLLTAREVEITDTAAEVLVTQLAAGAWTSVEVANAFLRRAGVAQRLVLSSV
jgi:amidase